MCLFLQFMIVGEILKRRPKVTKLEVQKEKRFCKLLVCKRLQNLLCTGYGSRTRDLLRERQASWTTRRIQH